MDLHQLAGREDLHQRLSARTSTVVPIRSPGTEYNDLATWM
jgi:hypothetical protein